MMKRMLLALALAASLGGAVVACNTPAATTNPISSPAAPAASTPAESAPAESAPAASTPAESMPAESPSAEPSAS
jgi:hypothetical protein